MTAEKPHCEHECVCWILRTLITSCPIRNPRAIPCVFNTATHSASEPEHLLIYDKEHPQGIPFPEYANIIRQLGASEARERVLDDIAQYIVKHSWEDKTLLIDVVTRYPLIEFMRSLRRKEGAGADKG